MKKIPTIFVRDETTHLVRDAITPGCEWFTEGKGIPTRKWDGTACLFREGKFYKRYDAKRGRTPPADFLPAQPEIDPITGHWPGWVPVLPTDKWHIFALGGFARPDGTYELCGPHINGNPDHLETECLVIHGVAELYEVPRAFDGLRGWLSGKDLEGIVFWLDGEPKGKIKLKDFGLKRP